ncbi:hypothetical protein GDO81_019210 [Engystomops pustulosus]|nr:hypothetical protein GDO81_019210 [Engystomops pustulosus]KAG8546335.1 hypothetical protein GDO81_019210 [Engystomops pustulosus]
MDLDAQYSSEDCAHEDLIRGPVSSHSDPFCTNALQNSFLLDSDQDNETQKQSSEHIKSEISPVFDDLYSMDETLSDDEGAFGGLSALPVEDTAVRRALCARCSRPEKVCLCPFLPAHPLNVSTCLYIVQHPAEVSKDVGRVQVQSPCPACNCGKGLKIVSQYLQFPALPL